MGRVFGGWGFLGGGRIVLGILGVLGFRRVIFVFLGFWEFSVLFSYNTVVGFLFSDFEILVY